ncbi:MAG TPA: hypothetical protein ENI15_05470 [Spirochaetes bacterium]|nr:hypothetical protein [Spirochaetota bacterium]
MITIGIRELKIHLSRYIGKVESGEEMIIYTDSSALVKKYSLEQDSAYVINCLGKADAIAISVGQIFHHKFPPQTKEFFLIMVSYDSQIAPLRMSLSAYFD